MDELLVSEIARRMWEAINPDGIPWRHMAHDEIKARMKAASCEMLTELGFVDVEGLTMRTAAKALAPGDE